MVSFNFGCTTIVAAPSAQTLPSFRGLNLVDVVHSLAGRGGVAALALCPLQVLLRGAVARQGQNG